MIILGESYLAVWPVLVKRAKVIKNDECRTTFVEEVSPRNIVKLLSKSLS